MSCCEVESNGQGSGAAVGGAAGDLSSDVETTDGAAQQIILARHPVDGAASTVEFYIAGSQTGPAAADEGDRGGWFKAWVSASRNSFGTNFLITGQIGPTGYEDPGGVPWNTIGVPVGWGYIGIAIAGTDLVLNFNGAAGQTIAWRIRGHRSFAGGATP